jgi:hypothetical protein
MRRLGLAPGSRAHRATLVAVRALADASELPGHSDFETSFAPGRAWVRRVPGENVWILYRFDDSHVDVMALRSEPPVPADDA